LFSYTIWSQIVGREISFSFVILLIVLEFIYISIPLCNAFINALPGMVHTEGESLQGGLGDVWTCRITLALAYMLCHLFAIWL